MWDIEEFLARTKAARRGFGGPWDDASVRAFLKGAGGFDALPVVREFEGC